MIQVAGVIDEDEAGMLIDCGVAYLGFPLRLPVNEEDLSEEQAAALIAKLPQGTHAVLITYLERAEDILAFCQQLGVFVVQLHGPVATEELIKIRMAEPQLKIIKSLVVRGDNLDELKMTIAATAPFIDAYITDTFDPRTGAEGATGMTHDWEVDRALVVLSPRPVILAGGLNADNVADAIAQVKPFGVDVHTGIEGRDGRKDPALTRRFVSEARAAFTAIGG